MYRIVENSKWPFDIRILDNENNRVCEIPRTAHSTGDTYRTMMKRQENIDQMNAIKELVSGEHLFAIEQE